jgi:hypothetical protein
MFNTKRTIFNAQQKEKNKPSGVTEGSCAGVAIRNLLYQVCRPKILILGQFTAVAGNGSDRLAIGKQE